MEPFIHPLLTACIPRLGGIMLARLVVGLSLACIALVGIGTARAADAYPARPVRWIVPYPPGGATDLVTRVLGGWLQERLGQPVVVENRPGGGTNIGVQAVVNAPP